MESTSTNSAPNFVHPSILKVVEQKKKIREKLSGIKHKVGVFSAKGGVGKTTTSVNIAFTLSSMGYKVGLLDADIDCPNVCMFLGIKDVIDMEYPLVPIEKDGVKVLSTAMYVDDNKKPIIWRGPMIGKMVSEFLENSEWGELDYLIIDMPPNTSDAPLSIIQLLDLDGFILVTTPQHISAVNTIRSGMMARRLGVAVLGVIENMSGDKPIGGEEVSKSLGCELLGTIKTRTEIGEFSDRGVVPVLEDHSIRDNYANIVKRLF
ncbi:MAG: Mrp/NBP35 family ATP-binding protein [Candidatus Marsarchaeota archaeon]|nr:Mrp/NBP35 family ATP-binding protein [Candidatus Marsarchaeota archaeon]